MAENKVVITTEVNTASAQLSLRELKKNIAAAQEQMLKGNKEAANTYNELKSKLNELNSAAKSATSSGIENLTGSFNTLKEGLANWDTGKIKSSLSGLGAAFKAVPVFLVVQGVQYLIENFESLSKGSGILAQSLRAVGDLFEWIKDGVYALTDAIGLTNSELDKQGEAIQSNADKAKEALSAQNAEFDRQIAVAKAAGKTTVELEKAKQEAIVQTNKQIVEQIMAFVRAGGELDEEKRKLLTASLESIRNARTQQRVIDLEEQTKTNEAKKVANQKYLDDLKKQQEEHNKWIIEADKALAEQRRLNEEQTNKMFQEQAQQQLKDNLAANNEIIVQGLQQVDTIKEMDYQRQVERERNIQLIDIEHANKRIEIASNTTKAIQGLSDLAFTIRMAKVKKGSEEEEKVAKKQFQVNKALQLGGAVIDGAKAITASLAAAPLAIGVVPNPAGIASLAAAITTSAANIAKIATTQYQSSGGGGGGETALPSLNLGGGGGETNAPTTAAPPTAPTTGLDEQGNVIGRSGVVKAVVVETDITGSQDRIKRYNNESSF